MRAWQATETERRVPLIGDGLVSEASHGATHAVTIRAPAERVWPWLVQMGYDRAGWYSYDLLDNGGRPSAETILPEFQHTRIGDILPTRPGRPGGFEVLRLEAPTALVLGMHLRLPWGPGLRWDAPHPDAFLRGTWVFVLRQDAADVTRLIVRARTMWQPGWAGRVAGPFAGPAHALMQRRQLLNLKERAERLLIQDKLPVPAGVPAFEL